MNKNLILALSALLISSFSWAVPEAQVPQIFMSKVMPYMQSQFSRGSFTGVDNIKINYYFKRVENPQGVLVIAPGQGEASLRYSELLYDLQDLNYSIYIIDHRGQGESQRLLADPIKSHVERFSDYVDDFSYFVAEVVRVSDYKKSIVLGHSMGGAIVAGFLDTHPNVVSAAILSAPMLEINTGIYGAIGADILANILDFIGLSTNYAPGQKPYDPNARFEDNKTIASRNRFEADKALYNKYPQIRVGGTTVNWVKQSLEYTTALRQKDNVYSVPTIILQAGSDQLVVAHGQNQSCGYSPNNCKIIQFPGAQHEILMEQDSIRNSALQVVRQFIQSR
ncbi:MAG: alpha/beta fold hydrolase [Pseudobdellovibrio sp.]